MGVIYIYIYVYARKWIQLLGIKWSMLVVRDLTIVNAYSVIVYRLNGVSVFWTKLTLLKAGKGSTDFFDEDLYFLEQIPSF